MKKWYMRVIMTTEAERRCILMLPGGTERLVRAAMRSWAETLRFCLIFSVILAALTIVAYLFGPSMLLSFIK
jgi:hypothetical protein